MTGRQPAARDDGEILRLHARALDEFGRRVEAVPTPRWSAPTPNPGWTVRNLVNHLVQEQLWVPPLLAGATLEDIGNRYDGDLLGNDPVTAWQSAAQGAREAFAAAGQAPGGLRRTVQLSYGPTPAGDYCREMTMDATVHAWDLARGAGLDDRLDEELLEDLHDRYADRAESLADSGLFAPVVQVPADADLQTRTLALFGRDARR